MKTWGVERHQGGGLNPQPSTNRALHNYSKGYATVPYSGSVVITAYDFESGRPSSNPEWGLIYYKTSITA